MINLLRYIETHPSLRIYDRLIVLAVWEQLRSEGDNDYSLSSANTVIINALMYLKPDNIFVRCYLINNK